jgi:hypothetical protein
MINLINYTSAETLTPGEMTPFGCSGHDIILMVFESTTIYAVSVYHQYNCGFESRSW